MDELVSQQALTDHTSNLIWGVVDLVHSAAMALDEEDRGAYLIIVRMELAQAYTKVSALHEQRRRG